MVNTIENIADQAKTFADLELQTYLSNLSSDQKSAFIASQINNAIVTVKSEKEFKFTDASDVIKGLDRDISSTMYYISRTNDLKNMADDVDSLTAAQLTTLESNKDLSIRQHEINEWSNSNKLDTLFFLQLLFVTLSFIAVLLFLKTLGLVSGYLFTLLTTVSGALLIFTLIVRYKYSVLGRDTRYWSKSRHPHQDPPAS